MLVSLTNVEPAVVSLRRRLGNVLDRQRGPRGSGAALHDLEDLAEVRAAVGDRLDDHGVGVRLAAVAVDLHGEDDEEQEQERDVDVGGPVAEIEQGAPDATAGRAAELLGLPGHEGRHGRRSIPRQVLLAGAGRGVLRAGRVGALHRVPRRCGW